MTVDELRTELEPVIREIFNKADLEIDDALCAKNLETWTSLSFLQLLSTIEDKYHFRFKIMEIPMLDNLGQVLAATIRHLSE